ncbi:glycosyltransferase family 4 protein [Candidatus Parcubacteria bacterium]|nr:glycosyltransferase family 4 protein [Patescibacteria group bacterium]MBU4380811.1 glycosyltransferase family 4 protein [Patescibacteria group bacterium]MCG2689476.1 glycosyltransferase family 4 protein [Candidatus Parcubacteria bacterium]
MKIGIDARLYGSSGLGRYIKNLISELEKLDTKNEYAIFLRSQNYELYTPQNPNFKKVLADFACYSLVEQIFFPIVLYQEKLDLLHVPHFNVPILYFKKHVITIHDLIMHSSGDANVKQLVYKLVVVISAIKARKIFIPTRASFDRIKKVLWYLNLDKKAVITYEGVDPIFYQSSEPDLVALDRIGITKPYILYVGNAYEHKNLRDLIIAFKKIVDWGEFTGSLVIVGQRDIYLARIKELAYSLSLQDRVIFPSFIEGYSYINDDTLSQIYQNANSYITASLEEGFNLTPLEAIASKIPCALSDIECHREVYQDSVLYFNPKSIIEIEEAIKRITLDEKLRESLVVKSQRLLLQYNWRDMAQKTLDGYLSVMGGTPYGYIPI